MGRVFAIKKYAIHDGPKYTDNNISKRMSLEVLGVS